MQGWLAAEGIRSKRRVTRAGRRVGGCNFTSGALRHILQNPVYLGGIRHKKKVYPGRHPAIIDRQIFDAVQALLERASERHRQRATHAERTLLNGLVFDADGLPMRPTFNVNKKRRYSYYASLALPVTSARSGRDGVIRRLPTKLLDDVVGSWVAKLTASSEASIQPGKVRSVVARIEVHPSAVILIVRASGVAVGKRRGSFLDIVRDLGSPQEEIRSDPANLNLIRITIPTRLVAHGGRKWREPPEGYVGDIAAMSDSKLVKDLRAGHRVLRACNIELDGFGLAKLRSMCAPTSGRDRRMARLAFLAPDIQRAILTGQPVRYPEGKIPLGWSEQRRLFGLPPAAAETTSEDFAEIGQTMVRA